MDRPFGGGSLYAEQIPQNFKTQNLQMLDILVIMDIVMKVDRPCIRILFCTLNLSKVALVFMELWNRQTFLTYFSTWFTLLILMLGCFTGHCCSDETVFTELEVKVPSSLVNYFLLL